MANSLKLGLLTTALSLGLSLAMSGSAPAGESGYEDVPPAHHGVDADGPAADDGWRGHEDRYGPAPAHHEHDGYGHDGYGHDGERHEGDRHDGRWAHDGHADRDAYAKGDGRWERHDLGEHHDGGERWSGAQGFASGGWSRGGESYSAHTDKVVREYGFDSGWHDAGRAFVHHQEDGDGGHHMFEGRIHPEGMDHTYHYAQGWGGRYGVAPNLGHSYGHVTVDKYEYDSGWRTSDGERAPPPPPPCHEMHGYGPDGCGVRYEEDVHVPDTFFADTGGVGPDWIDSGGGGGGFGFVEGSGRASASAFASASARVSIGFHGHGGGHKGGHMGGHKSGCGCK